MPGKQVFLVICHTFPPYQGIGGRRWAKFSKAMARQGHEVHVVCSSGSAELKGSLWTTDVETPGIFIHELPQHYPTVLFKRPLITLRDRFRYHFWLRAMRLLVKGNWFDKTILWEKQLVTLCDRLILKHGITAVVVSGAPFSLMSHALRVKKKHPSVRFVADFRDPWTWAGGYGYPSLPAQRQARERALEAEAVNTYDIISSPHISIIDHLRTTYGGDLSKYHYLPHAFDPDELPSAVERSADGLFKMVYAGNVYDPAEATGFFEALFAGLERLGQLDPTALKRCVLDIYITDGDASRYREDAQRRGLGDQVRFHEPLGPQAFFASAARADLALAFIPKANRDLLGTKFHELFYLRLPVLHIGEPGVVSGIITSKRLGDTVRVEEFATELPKLILRERVLDIDTTADVSQHRLDVVTEKLLALLT